MVTNNSFIDQIAFDGMRQHLQKDFTQIYHLDLHGNVRKNPKISGSSHNVFGIQVGVGITIAIRASKNPKRAIYYYRVPENWRKTQKLAFLNEKESLSKIDWLEIYPDDKYTWLTEGMRPEFPTFIPLGSKAAKGERHQQIQTFFKTYAPGVSTARDNWVYAFTASELSVKVKAFIDTYNGEVDRWKRRTNDVTSVDGFVTYDDAKMKWSRDLKADLQRGHYAKYEESKVRISLYRPFCKQILFLDRILNEEVYQNPQFFPSKEHENIAICLTNLGSEKPFMSLAVDSIPNYHLVGAGAVTVCFPFYTYSEDGNHRQENIADWVLEQFQKKYGMEITKRNIFHYIYAMLHHPQYRELYKENLKRDLPRIPLLQHEEACGACISVGKQLMEMHVSYEQAEEYKLKEVDNGELSYEQSRRVDKKMKLSEDKTAVIVNKALTLEGIPQECFEYRLGNRSALEWVIDQYQISTAKRSGIENNPNRPKDPEYIIRLVKQIVTLSVKTTELVKELAEAVTVDDWLNDTVEGSN
jgi:predicted helicase